MNRKQVIYTKLDSDIWSSWNGSADIRGRMRIYGYTTCGIRVRDFMNIYYWKRWTKMISYKVTALFLPSSGENVTVLISFLERGSNFLYMTLQTKSLVIRKNCNNFIRVAHLHFRKTALSIVCLKRQFEFSFEIWYVSPFWSWDFALFSIEELPHTGVIVLV